MLRLRRSPSKQSSTFKEFLMSLVKNVSKQSFVQEVLRSPLPVLVDFYANWCGPCRTLAPRLDTLADEFAGQVQIVKVDVDAESELAGRFQVQSVPTLVFIAGGQVVGRTSGLVSEDILRSAFNELAGNVTPPTRHVG
jgi:thioredoxin